MIKGFVCEFKDNSICEVYFYDENKKRVGGNFKVTNYQNIASVIKLKEQIKIKNKDAQGSLELC